MPRLPDPDYPHLNKKKIVVLVVVAMMIMLLLVVWAAEGTAPAPLPGPAWAPLIR